MYTIYSIIIESPPKYRGLHYLCVDYYACVFRSLCLTHSKFGCLPISNIYVRTGFARKIPYLSRGDASQSLCLCGISYVSYNICI